MAGGPLIPGLKEFDGPKRGVPRLVWWLVVLVLLVGLGLGFLGVFAGVGPLRSLGLVTDALTPVAFRPTTDEQVVQVALAVPPEGLCDRAPIDVLAQESVERVVVSASVTSLRNASCTKSMAGEGQVWVDVFLEAPLGSRMVVKASDGRELPRQTSANLGG